MARNRALKFSKRHLLDKPTLAESKFAIVLTATFLSLFSGFYYMLFHFQYPSDMLEAVNLHQHPQTAESEENGRPAQLAPLKLTSIGFADSYLIPTKYTCAAGATTVSPPLE